ncbi:hemicentin-2-like [Antedon mediterranea]|uniref:hemicentin-2-like n=1 Tax=Antedon mediterranea TaxID=105859 RepID=UPI003AF5BF7B
MLELRMFVVIVILMNQVISGNGQQQFTVEPTNTQVTVGQTATLLCTVSNKLGVLTWTKDGATPISADTNVFGGSQYSLGGDQSSGEYNLVISNTAEEDSGNYQCIVTASGSDPMLESNVAVLTVQNEQSFTIEPTNTNVFQGSTAVLFCNVENKEGSVQWLKESVPFTSDTTITSGGTRYSIIGSQANGDYNLQIVSSEESDSGSYQCSVTAAGGSSAITSSVAMLTIATSGQRFLVIPSDVTTTEGSDVTFRCEVADKVGTLSWLYNGQSISDDESIDLDRHSVVGNYSDGEYNLVISEVTKSESGTYHCVINSDGISGAASSSPASLVVLDAVAPADNFPTCSIFPNTNLFENQNVTLLCESEGGDPAAKLSWQVGQSFIDGEYVSEPYARNTLELQLVADLIGAEYSCRSTHPTYTSTKICNIGALRFELIPTIGIAIEPARQEIIENQAGSIECIAVGDPVVLGYKWYMNGALINSSDSRFTIDTTDTEKSVLSIVSAEKSMDGSLIRCEARNRIDTSSLTSSIQVIEEESDLYKYVLAVLCLIGIVILAAIVIGIIAAYCYRKQKKLNKVAPSKDVEASVVENEKPTGALPPPEATPEPPKKMKKRHRKHRHRGSKIVEHVVHAEPREGPYQGNYYVARRDIYDGYLSPNGYHPGYPVMSYSPDMRVSKNGSYINGGSKRGLYDLEKARQLNGSITPSPRLSLSVDSKKGSVTPDHQKVSTVYTVSGRNKSVSPDRRERPRKKKVSLSPGEYNKREEYEKKVQELEEMRRNINSESPERSRRKHRKHKKSTDSYR